MLQCHQDLTQFIPSVLHYAIAYLSKLLMILFCFNFHCTRVSLKFNYSHKVYLDIFTRQIRYFYGYNYVCQHELYYNNFLILRFIYDQCVCLSKQIFHELSKDRLIYQVAFELLIKLCCSYIYLRLQMFCSFIICNIFYK